MRWNRGFSKASRWGGLGAAVVSVALLSLFSAALLRGEEDDSAAQALPASPGTRHPVRLRPAGGEPRMATGEVDAGGAPVVVACSTCHSLREGKPAARTARDLKEFHKGMALAHGGRTCLACHDARDYDALKLADGTALPFREARLLCAQCHGAQARDYEHGAHGGMSGYWDLRRGPRMRNQCVHCHDPHVPAFPRMRPTFKPRDRFLGGGGHHER